MRTVLLLVVALASLSAASCKKAKPIIVGKWQEPAGGVFEFRSDGILVTTSATTGKTNQVKYRFVDETTIELTTLEGNVAGQLVIDSLTQTEVGLAFKDAGKRYLFRRVQ
ncbi:MAG: hypothetical protein U0746_21635 [Gemmataceae bacterium]